MEATIDLILVDDHQIILDGLEAMLLGEMDIRVLGRALHGKALFELLERVQPHIVVLDLQLPQLSGIEIAERLRQAYPNIYVLILTAESDQSTILAATRKGIRGFLPKDCPRQELLQAIRTIAQGGVYYAQSIAPLIFASFSEQLGGQSQETPLPHVLSEREIEVLKGFADGLSYKEIAAQLFISSRTVESHKKSIFKKLHLNNHAELVKYAIKHQLTRLD